MLTLEHLKTVLDYDPTTGIFIWKECYYPERIGTQAGSTKSNGSKGYRVIWIDGITYRADKLAWWIMLGWPPINDVRHANKDRDDNRIANLRYAGFENPY